MIIVLSGFIHSGTSYVAEFLIKHGADPGICSPWMGQDYKTYENAIFKNYCARLLKIDTDGLDPTADVEQDLLTLLAAMDPSKTYLLKYPKAIAIGNRIRELIDAPVRFVFVTRQWEEWSRSYRRRTGTSGEYAAKDRMTTLFAMSEYRGPLMMVDFRALQAGDGQKELLDYVGLKGKVNV